MEPIKKFSFRKQIINVFIFSVFLVLFSSCEEVPLKAGFNLLGNDTLEIKADTLAIELYTVASGPYRAASYSTSLLGSLNDPVFGQLNAELLTDVLYTEYYVSYADKKDTDMVVLKDMELQLKYTSFYGDTTGFDFDVYEMTSAVPDTSTDFDPENYYDPLPLNIGKPLRIFIDTTNIDTIKNTYTLNYSYNVKLRNDYAEKYLNQQMITDSGYYMKFKDDFKQLIKGFYIKPKNNGGLISIDHKNSKLLIHTIQKINGVNDTIEDEFYLGYHPDVGGLHINTFKNISGTEISKVFNDTLKINSQAYIQSLAGPQILVKIPGLKQKRTEFGYKMVINKAELVLPVNKTYLNDLYKPPYIIGIRVRDSLANNRVLDDGQVNITRGSSPNQRVYNSLNGVYDPARFQYTLNIGNQIHEFLRDQTGSAYGDSFYIFGADWVYSSINSALVTVYSIQTPGRVVLNNSDAIESKPYLRIIYSKIPE
jgi:hypothetical protein